MIVLHGCHGQRTSSCSTPSIRSVFPTSTTVSIVFELMGAAFAAALLQVSSTRALRSADVADYINSSKSLGIVSGILDLRRRRLHFGRRRPVSRRASIFTFKFEKATTRRIGAIYGGIALTAIIYFLVMKGAKGASFMRPEWISVDQRQHGRHPLARLLHGPDGALPGAHHGASASTSSRSSFWRVRSPSRSPLRATTS